MQLSNHIGRGRITLCIEHQLRRVALPAIGNQHNACGKTLCKQFLGVCHNTLCRVQCTNLARCIVDDVGIERLVGLHSTRCCVGVAIDQIGLAQRTTSLAHLDLLGCGGDGKCLAVKGDLHRPFAPNISSRTRNECIHTELVWFASLCTPLKWLGKWLGEGVVSR